MNKKLYIVLDQSHINNEIIDNFFKVDDWLCFIENDEHEISQYFKVKFIRNNGEKVYFLSKVFLMKNNTNWLIKGFSNTDDESSQIFKYKPKTQEEAELCNDMSILIFRKENNKESVLKGEERILRIDVYENIDKNIENYSELKQKLENVNSDSHWYNNFLIEEDK